MDALTALRLDLRTCVDLVSSPQSWVKRPPCVPLYQQCLSSWKMEQTSRYPGVYLKHLWTLPSPSMKSISLRRTKEAMINTYNWQSVMGLTGWLSSSEAALSPWRKCRSWQDWLREISLRLKWRQSTPIVVRYWGLLTSPDSTWSLALLLWSLWSTLKGSISGVFQFTGMPLTKTN
jgi:hypothetical protein